MGDYKWRTFKEVSEEAAAFGRGLRLLGHQPKENVIIFGETRAEWMVAAQGCFKQNFPSKLKSILINNFWYITFGLYILFQGEVSNLIFCLQNLIN